MRTLQEMEKDLKTARSNVEKIQRYTEQDTPFTQADAEECDSLITATKTLLKQLSIDWCDAGKTIVEDLAESYRDIVCRRKDRETIIKQLGTAIYAKANLYGLGEAITARSADLERLTTEFVTHP